MMYALGACQCAGCRKAMDRVFWDLILDAGLEPTAIEGEAEEVQVTAAYELGKEHGMAAASWLLDGNSSREAAERLLRGLNDGDPVVLDSLPSNPLSGEWADAPTAKDILRELGEEETDPDAQWDILRDYEDGYSDGVQQGAERTARQFLGIPDGADAEAWLLTEWDN